MVVSGAEYLHETFDREFEVHSEEEFQKEHGKDKIEVETWFSEKGEQEQ